MSDAVPEVIPPQQPTGEAFFERVTKGRPSEYVSAGTWVTHGVGRQGFASVITALLCGWSLIPFVIWLSLFVGIITGILAFFGVNSAFPAVSTSIFAPTVNVLSVVVGAFLGVIATFFGMIWLVLTQAPLGFLTSIVGGAILSVLITGVMIAVEPWTLKLRGCRRLSSREQARVIPLLHAVGQAMQLRAVPPLLIADGSERNAQTYPRHIVLDKALVNELDDHQLSGILAHELHHWKEGETIGLRFIWACSLPVTAAYNLGTLLSKSKHQGLALFAWALLWPAWVTLHFVLLPVIRVRSRSNEYSCDAAAQAAGFGKGLYEALEYMGDFENGRTGWAEVLHATHPPMELRLERLELSS